MRSINEGRNADRFRRNFREESWVKVPRVFWQFRCARRLGCCAAPPLVLPGAARVLRLR